MSFLKSVMSYLGLGPEDSYDDYDLPPEPERPVSRARMPQASETMDSGAVRTIPTRQANPRAERDMLSPRPAPMMDEQPPPRRTGSGTVRAVPNTNSGRPHTVRPRTFNQAQEVADRFKEGQAVIVNLESVDREVARRLIDFASGLCYGLGGAMEKVASGVYLLTPTNVSISAEDRRNMGNGNGNGDI
jgi:cell division inhibitor SepF